VHSRTNSLKTSSHIIKQSCWRSYKLGS